MDNTLLSLAAFAVAMCITPGPNNVMLASSGAIHGFRATMPHAFGIACGFAVMLMVVSGGLGSVLVAWPPLLPIMRWAGMAWMLWLAWKIASAPPPAVDGDRNLLGFWGAAGFQWINPKAWMIALGAASQFTRPDLPLTGQLITIGVVFLLVCVPCTLPWVLFGVGAGRLLQSGRWLRAFNIVMALLLVVSLLPVLTEE